MPTPRCVSLVFDDRRALAADASPSQLDGLIAAVLSSMSSAQKSEVKAWEEEITTCIHTTELVQPAPKKLEPSGESPSGHPFAPALTLVSQVWPLVLTRVAASRRTFGCA